MTPDELYYQLTDNNIFLSGGAGVGKSYLTSKIIDLYKNEGKNVVPLGSTGISAVNIGGYTLHSFFVFGIASSSEELRIQDRKNRSRISELKKVLQNLDLIVIDEISMVSANLIDMIYYRLESLGYSGRLLVVGDFYQLPPIVKSERSDALFLDSFYAFESSAWSKFGFKAVILSEIKRTKDLEFANILSYIRKGGATLEVREYLKTLLARTIPSESDPTYLFGRNKEVEEMNRAKLAKIESDAALYFWEIDTIRNVNEKRLKSWASGWR
jgi:ATP-dependent DNA helicase PIF1